MKYDYIIWDFNGTIIDDRQLCLDILNKMLKERNIKTVSLEEYQDIFGFPVIDYYRKVGFNFNVNPFSELAIEFIDLYQKASLKVGLVPGSLETIKALKEKGYKQIMLSASERGNLLEQVHNYHLEGYFDEVLGLTDIEATSKAALGKKFLDTLPKNSRLLMIGDSIHDHEVALELGADCFLVCEGSHQNKKRLEQTGCRVYDNCLELIKELQMGNHLFSLEVEELNRSFAIPIFKTAIRSTNYCQ